jgi:putative transposase
MLPTEEQKVLLNKHFGCIRFVYNYYLTERKREYEESKKTLSYVDNASAMAQLKKQEDYSWLKEVNSQALQQSLKGLDSAYISFFKKRTMFPRYKSKNKKNSFTIPQHVSVNNKKLFVPKFKEGIKLIQHRVLCGEIKHCTLSKTTTGEYFASILCLVEHKPKKKTGREVGVDLGLKDFAITSDGYKFKNHRYLKTYGKKLKKAQQHLSRKTKGSGRYNKQKYKVAVIHKKITNSRTDTLNKISSQIINEYDVVYLEDLNIKGMMSRCKPKQDENGRFLPNGQSAKSGLNHSIADASWSKFLSMLEYKAKWNDKQIVQINRFFPSSKTCENCGFINKNLSLRDRSWTCPNCKTTLDRDFNAAKNILKEGRKNISAGTVDYRRGDEIRPSKIGTIRETSKVLM